MATDYLKKMNKLDNIIRKIDLMAEKTPDANKRMELMRSALKFIDKQIALTNKKRGGQIKKKRKGKK